MGLGTGLRIVVLTILVSAMGPRPVLASLISLPGGMVYDDVLNITWLQDANYGAGSSYDDGASTTDGRMTWQHAVDWAASLDYGGYDDWRLPAANQPDGSCTPSPPWESTGSTLGFNCTGSPW